MAIGLATAKRANKKPTSAAGRLNCSGFAGIGAEYRKTIRQQLEQLWQMHFDGTLQPALTVPECELIAEVRTGGEDVVRTRATEVLEIVRYREHVLRALETAGRTDTGGLTPPRSPGLVVDLSLDLLQTLAANPDPDPAEVSRIAASLQERGQDEPILVLPSSRLPLAITLDRGKGWLVLAGATRLAAARQLGWTTIAAREREAMNHEEILAFAYRNNADRRSVGTAERAQYAAAIFSTLPESLSKSDREAAVGTRMGLERSEVNQLLRFSDLPAKWQQRVRAYEIDREASDGISWSCAKAFLPYVHLAAFRDGLDKQWKNFPYNMRRKDSVRNVVQWIVRDCTRPADEKTKHDYGWQNGGDQPRLYDLTAELRAQLKIEKLPLGKGGKDVEVITNVALNDKLQEPFLKKIAQRQNAQNNGRTEKPVAKKTLTPAQERAKHSEQDQQLERRICGEGGLREQALRLAMATRLKLGHWTTDGLCDDLLCTSRDSSGSSYLDVSAWRYEGQLQLRTDKAASRATGQLSGCISKEAYAAYSIGSVDMLNDPADDLLRVRLYTCQAILWPAAGKGVQSSRLCPADEIPERFPAIVPAVLEHWAEWLCASVQDTWVDAATAGPARKWLQRFFESHNRRQLQALAASIGATALIDRAKTGADEVGKLMAAHRAADRLAMPSCLRQKSKKGKK